MYSHKHTAAAMQVPNTYNIIACAIATTTNKLKTTTIVAPTTTQPHMHRYQTISAPPRATIATKAAATTITKTNKRDLESHQATQY
jgi:hypothetical protein